MKSPKGVIFFLLVSCLSISYISAQDSHYWTEQYGTKSMLLSNSVVGSVEDLGAVYYNPGRLSLIENSAFVISGKVYQLTNTRYTNATGEGAGANEKSSSFGGAPSLVAGTFKMKGLEEHHFAYAFLRRKGMDMELTANSEIFGDVIEVMPGEEYFSGNISLGKSFNEEWIGGSWSYSLTKNFSVGVTGFLAIRNQDASRTTQLQAYSEEGKVETYFNKKNYSYNTMGLVWKLGLALDQEPFSVGLTFTTPTIKLSNSGSFHYERIYTGLYSNEPIYERGVQKDLDVTYRTPFSIAGGFGVKLFKGMLHCSAEYYNSIGYYKMMEGEVFMGQSSGREIHGQLYDELNSVFNYGVGYNFVFSDKVNGYLSYAADYGAATNDDNDLGDEDGITIASNLGSKVDHFGGGIVLNLKRADITLGATLASSEYGVNRPIDFPDGDDNSIVNPNDKSTINWNRWRFIVGISIPMFDSFVKKLEDKISGE